MDRYCEISRHSAGDVKAFRAALRPERLFQILRFLRRIGGQRSRDQPLIDPKPAHPHWRFAPVSGALRCQSRTAGRLEGGVSEHRKTVEMKRIILRGSGKHDLIAAEKPVHRFWLRHKLLHPRAGTDRVMAKPVSLENERHFKARERRMGELIRQIADIHAART